MAADDELPRGWIASTGLVNAGVTPSITIPAAPGITHVITDIEFDLYYSSTANAFAPVVETGTGFEFGIVATVGGQSGRDSLSLSGSQLYMATGVAVVIALNSNIATGTSGLLLVRGYDF